MIDIDRGRAQQLMREAEIDALVLFQPDAFRYAVGAPAGVATMWGKAGSAIALVPADAGAGLAAVVSDHAAPIIRRAAPDIDLRCHRIWIDLVDLSGVETIAQVDDAYRRNNSGGARPETFDRTACFGLLSDLLRERGLSAARIGADLEFMPAADFFALRQALPEVNWVDGSTVLKRLRAVKSQREIKLLRQASAAAEAGLVEMAAAVRPGAALGQLSAAWKSGAQAYAAKSGFSLSGHWDFISVGPALSDMTAAVAPGALIKADVGTLVDGYSSDGARTFSWGPVSPFAGDIFKALEAAFARGLDALRPGNTFGAVHAAMLASMRKDGFGEYYRGHFGQSVGGSVGIEEWPFFSHDNPELILPGMVVALEAPFYGEGVGALMIEDQFLVTASGAECMNSLPRTLRDLSAD
ncbi:Xaa-Pro peptidase family protein [Rhizobium pusense]|uniref:M24 family metallopeptidase n=1 Tax=Agrobacterium pusense TaxID=648995 RepID=UPI000D19C21B|nr:Xaa-Pro peptidase family protein [Agrobacterium pusense]HCJ73550.1 aminopeptidase P family protein [Agrobacterium sp.]MDH0911476.1 Xaa-Pro peptidase family protein [Agrobacterium pusense]MDH1096705.1 Xaa-Pro peptidase family protein [Agrobacterium pusense]MDH1113971.1 Xaa-Pro peptidase family protein [Agrobacterium pusense]MDH2194293.1 Xaa-Pro peptidase family protein [Agrobacterium pusense]